MPIRRHHRGRGAGGTVSHVANDAEYWTKGRRHDAHALTAWRSKVSQEPSGTGGPKKSGPRERHVCTQTCIWRQARAQTTWTLAWLHSRQRPTAPEKGADDMHECTQAWPPNARGAACGARKGRRLYLYAQAWPPSARGAARGPRQGVRRYPHAQAWPPSARGAACGPRQGVRRYLCMMWTQARGQTACSHDPQHVTRMPIRKPQMTWGVCKHVKTIPARGSRGNSIPSHSHCCTRGSRDNNTPSHGHSCIGPSATFGVASRWPPRTTPRN